MTTTESIYEGGKYLQNNPTWHEEDSAWKAQQILRVLRSNGLNPATLCEIGCGAGAVLHQLSIALDNGVKCTGYEISPQAFDLCKSRSRSNLIYLREDLLRTSLPPFDVVMAIDVFEHVEDYLGFLRQLRLKGRYKIFHIPLDISVQSVLRSEPIVRLRMNVGHLHYFTQETALATLRDTGYRVIDYFHTASALDLPNRGLKANLMKVPRKLLFALHRDFAARLLGGFSLMVLCE